MSKSPYWQMVIGVVPVLAVCFWHPTENSNPSARASPATHLRPEKPVMKASNFQLFTAVAADGVKSQMAQCSTPIFRHEPRQTQDCQIGQLKCRFRHCLTPAQLGRHEG